MRASLFSSVVLHAAILGWACLTIQAQQALPTPELVAPADLVTEDELTRLRQGQRTAKVAVAEAKQTPKTEPTRTEAHKPTPQAAAPPAPSPPPPEKQEPEKQEPDKVAALPPPASPPPPAPGPAPEEQQRLDELVKEQERQAEEQRQEQERQAEEQRKEQERQAEQRKEEERKHLEEEQKKAELKRKLEEEKRRKEAELKKKREEERKRKEAEKKRFDAERIAALLNKVPDKGAPPPPQAPSEPTHNKGPALGAPEGRDKQLTASELAVLGQIIKSCVQAKWNLSGGGQDAMNLVIKLRLQFRPDGTLLAPPQVTNPQNTPYFLAASEGAIRAAQACEPYSLPTEKYEFWRDVIMTFDPREMYR